MLSGIKMVPIFITIPLGRSDNVVCTWFAFTLDLGTYVTTITSISGSEVVTRKENDLEI